MNYKNPNDLIKFYENIDKETLLMIEQTLLPHTGLFLYPDWLQNILSNYLAWQVKRKYKKIQLEIVKLKDLILIK